MYLQSQSVLFRHLIEIKQYSLPVHILLFLQNVVAYNWALSLSLYLDLTEKLIFIIFKHHIMSELKKRLIPED